MQTIGRQDIGQRLRGRDGKVDREGTIEVWQERQGER